MKCPSCQFELKNPGPNCPFCQALLPAGQRPAQTVEGAQGQGVPTPGEQGHTPIPESEPGAAQPKPDRDASEIHIPDPMEVAAQEDGRFEPAVKIPDPVPVSSGGNGIKIAAIVGGAFLAYQLGMFDNILMLVKMSASANDPVAADSPATAPDPAIPTIHSVETAELTPADAPKAPTAARTEQTFNPLEDPRMQAMNAEVQAKLDAADAAMKKIAEKTSSADDAPRAAGNEEEFAEDWIFRGRIYDMISGKPVADANMMLMDNSQQQIFTTVSDSKGGFSFDVPSVEGGYKLVVDHPYYLADYFDETNPPYSKMPMNKRRQLRSAKPRHPPWVGGGRPIRRDIVLFPEIPDR